MSLPRCDPPDPECSFQDPEYPSSKNWEWDQDDGAVIVCAVHGGLAPGYVYEEAPK